MSATWGEILLKLENRGNPVFLCHRKAWNMLDEIIRALALVLVFEGVMPFVAPRRWREIAAFLGTLDERTMRFAGLFSMVSGLVVLFLWR
jgi:uncharacterized protein YjeT (DUF2065 family)